MTSPAINLPQAELASAGLSLLRPPMEVTELHGKLLTTAATIQLPMPTIAAPPPTLTGSSLSLPCAEVAERYGEVPESTMQATIPIATVLPSKSAGQSSSLLSPSTEHRLSMTAASAVPITRTSLRSTRTTPGHSQPSLTPTPGTLSPSSLTTPRNAILSGPSSSLQILSDAAVLGSTASASASREQRQANPL